MEVEDDNFMFSGDEDLAGEPDYEPSSPVAEADDLGYLDDMPARQRHKEYEVESKVLPAGQLEALMARETQELASVLGLRASEATALLHAFQWKQDRLLEAYYEDEHRTLCKVGLAVPKPVLPRTQIQPVPGFLCDICYDDSPDKTAVTLICGHRACKECYSQYVTAKIMSEGEPRVRCIAKNCDVLLPEETLRQLADAKTMDKYNRLQVDLYMRHREYFKWCPAPRCDCAIECHILANRLDYIVPTVKCQCGNVWCFGCGSQDHQPATCRIVKRWLKKCADDSETANWISAHTKECPKCGATIEKNGGCNHMTCKKCKHEFCWVCQGPWSEHGSSWYNCNRFDQKAAESSRGTQQAKSRADLERYLHYFTRYDNHDRSAKLDTEVYKSIEKNMEALQAKTELSWIEVQFMKQAADVLFQARMVLKWTYAFAFYLQRNNQTEIFEDNQRDLEFAVEQLSEMLERPLDLPGFNQARAAAIASGANSTPKSISVFRQEILDKMQYVASRREVLLSDTARGLLEDRWQYQLELAPSAPVDVKSP